MDLLYGKSTTNLQLIEQMEFDLYRDRKQYSLRFISSHIMYHKKSKDNEIFTQSDQSVKHGEISYHFPSWHFAALAVALVLPYCTSVLLYWELVLVLDLYLSTIFVYLYLHAKYWYMYWNLDWWYWYWYLALFAVHEFFWLSMFIKSAINYICYFVSHNLVASAEN